MAVRRDDETAAAWRVSTGRRPPSERVRSLVIDLIERSPDGRTNPMVNSGAIGTTSLVPGRIARDLG